MSGIEERVSEGVLNDITILFDEIIVCQICGKTVLSDKFCHINNCCCNCCKECNE